MAEMPEARTPVGFPDDSLSKFHASGAASARRSPKSAIAGLRNRQSVPCTLVREIVCGLSEGRHGEVEDGGGTLSQGPRYGRQASLVIGGKRFLADLFRTGASVAHGFLLVEPCHRGLRTVTRSVLV